MKLIKKIFLTTNKDKNSPTIINFQNYFAYNENNEENLTI